MPDKPVLPSVAPGGWIVLGLLVQDAPQSGYDLASRATRGIAHFWPITKAQVYAELPRLEAAGLVEGEVVIQEGAPDKRLYRPTAAGQAAFSSWLANVDLGEAKLRHPLLLRLWFSSEADLAPLRAGCERHREALEAQQARFEELIERLDARTTRSAASRRSSAHRRLALRHGLLRIDAEIQWLSEVDTVLNGRPPHARRTGASDL